MEMLYIVVIGELGLSHARDNPGGGVNQTIRRRAYG